MRIYSVIRLKSARHTSLTDVVVALLGAIIDKPVSFRPARTVTNARLRLEPVVVENHCAVKPQRPQIAACLTVGGRAYFAVTLGQSGRIAIQTDPVGTLCENKNTELGVARHPHVVSRCVERTDKL